MAKCPCFENYGFCNAGLSCRFFNAHRDKILDSETKKISFPDSATNPLTTDYKNVLDYKIQNSLRKKQYQFNKSKQAAEFTKKVQKEVNKRYGNDGVVMSSDPLACYRDTKEEKPTGFAFPEKKKLDFRGKTYLAPLRDGLENFKNLFSNIRYVLGGFNSKKRCYLYEHLNIRDHLSFRLDLSRKKSCSSFYPLR